MASPHVGTSRPSTPRPNLPPKKIIRGEIGEPYEDNGKWTVKIICSVVLSEVKQVGENIRIFRNLDLYYEEKTDKNGEYIFLHDDPSRVPGERVNITLKLTGTETSEKPLFFTIPGSSSPVTKSNKLVKLTAGIPVKNGDNFEATVLAQVLENDVPMKDVDVRLFFDSAEVHLGRSDDDGKISHQLTIPARFAGLTVPLKAQLTGADAAKEKEISVIVPGIKTPEPPKKPEAKYAEIEEHGADGSYYLTVQILDENERGAVFPLVLTEKCFVGRNTILPNAQNLYRLNTDPTGYVVIQLTNFDEKKRTIHVQVEGSRIDREIKLDGPKPPTFKGQLNLNAGFFGNLFQGRNNNP